MFSTLSLTHSLSRSHLLFETRRSVVSSDSLSPSLETRSRAVSGDFFGLSRDAFSRVTCGRVASRCCSLVAVGGVANERGSLRVLRVRCLGRCSSVRPCASFLVVPSVFRVFRSLRGSVRCCCFCFCVCFACFWVGVVCVCVCVCRCIDAEHRACSRCVRACVCVCVCCFCDLIPPESGGVCVFHHQSHFLLHIHSRLVK